MATCSSKEKFTEHLSLHGRAQEFEAQIRQLLSGQLPEGWKWVPSSDEAIVARSGTAPVVFYKEFLARSRFEKIKALLRGNRSQRARKQAEILTSIGMPTPTVLCWGKSPSKNFIISQGFSGVGFYQFLEENFAPPLDQEQIQQKRQLLREIGTLIGTLHQNKIIHGDLRPNNVLVSYANKGYQFSFIDNEGNSRFLYLPTAKIIKNLVQFSMITNDYLNRTDLLRIYKAYRLTFTHFPVRQERKMLRTIYQRSRERIITSRKKFYQKKHCRTLEQKNFHGQYLSQAILHRQLEKDIDPKHWFDSGNITLKRDKSITVKLLEENGSKEKIVVKRFSSKNFLYHLKVWSKRERVFSLWDLTHSFQTVGIPTAAPLGYILEGKGLWRTVSYFYTQYLEGADNLQNLSRQMDNFPAWLEKKMIIERFARLLARLHNSGYCHGDTKWANIMADPKTGKFWLIDLDGATSGNALLSHEVRKDISRFLVDMVEFHLPQAVIENFTWHYCQARNMKHHHLHKKIAPQLQKTLARHKRKRK